MHHEKSDPLPPQPSPPLRSAFCTATASSWLKVCGAVSSAATLASSSSANWVRGGKTQLRSFALRDSSGTAVTQMEHAVVWFSFKAIVIGGLLG